MGQKIHKFVPRAPRYVLRPTDRNTMRFSLEHTLGEGGIEQTILINLSESGAAFLVSAGADPRVGERIKVEVPIPGGEQFAWWGKVVRTSVYEPNRWSFKNDRFAGEDKILIALKFDELPESGAKAIRLGLKNSYMQAMRDQQFLTWQYYKNNFLQQFIKYLIYTVLTALVIGFIYRFSRPDANYDAKRGTPWGERFKF